MIFEALLCTALISDGCKCEEEHGPRWGIYESMEEVKIYVAAEDKARPILAAAEKTARSLGLSVVGPDVTVSAKTGALVVTVTCSEECVVRVALMRVAYVGRYSKLRPYSVVLWTKLYMTDNRGTVKAAKEGLEEWADDYRLQTQSEAA